ncbi:MAG TPA: NUDIX hydrolase [Candidatus Onthovivens sp.]|nr:NUDIX hydrolase [Candidatus Onthovivens sp.]
MDIKEKKIDSEIVFKGKLLEVHKDNILLPNQQRAIREYINKIAASCIIAIKDDGKIILESQFRYPFNNALIEFPAGKCDEGEDSSVTARRELLEEAGYEAKNLEYLGKMYPSPAYTNEVIHLYLATNLIYKKQNLDENEFMNLFEVSEAQLDEMILSGEISDAKTICAWHLYKGKKKNV